VREVDPSDPAPAARGRCRDWLAFQRAFALRPLAARALLARHGRPGPALRASGVRRDEAWEERARATLARLGAQGLPLGAERYPARLAELGDGPVLLWLLGRPESLQRVDVAIVGARAPTPYGVAVARVLAARLAGRGVGVVSGLAHGVDAAAHDATLAAGGETVAVLGCGIDRVYPAAHRGLARRIATQGCVASEFAPGTPPLPMHFPLRNRIVSGLARVVVVAEARRRSGSLVTASHALDQGRDVFAAPGPLDAPASAGCNRLIRDGAHILLEADDVLLRLGFRPARKATPGDADVDPVLALLRERPCTRDELADRLGARPALLARKLLELELAGRVTEGRDGRLRAVSGEVASL